MVRVVINDVAIRIVFATAMPLDEAPAGETAVVWLDDAGRMRFLGPPHLHRFLQSLNYDQLRALA